MNTPIVIMTDFGTTDPFVGIMKGVIAGISPGTPIIDLTHEIPPGDIRRGAITLWQSVSYFPRGSIFLSVVDPGVGTKRRPILLETQGHRFIGPDNGIFSYIKGVDAQSWVISQTGLKLPLPSKTFHGRDIFAPAAAQAAEGVTGSEFGNKVSDLQVIPFPILSFPNPGMVYGEILLSDRFGNALTSLGAFYPRIKDGYTLKSWINPADTFDISLDYAHLILPNKAEIPYAATFSEIHEGDYAFVVGSSGLIEIAANRKNATRLLNLEIGNPVKLTYPISEDGRRYP